MCHTLGMKLYGWVGDKVESLRLDLFVDADLAGETKPCQSTSGVFFAICGPNTRWPITYWTVEETASYFAQYA